MRMKKGPKVVIKMQNCIRKNIHRHTQNKVVTGKRERRGDRQVFCGWRRMVNSIAGNQRVSGLFGGFGLS